MSSRLHNKFHRHNHHTYNSTDVRYPDAGHDPIASPDSPFQGEFILQGALSAYARLSAYTAYFPGDNVSLLLRSDNWALSSEGNVYMFGEGLSSINSKYLSGYTLNFGDIDSYGGTYLQGLPELTYFDDSLQPEGSPNSKYTLTVFGILSTLGNTYAVGNVHRTGTSYVSSGTNYLTGSNFQYGNNTYYGTLSSIGNSMLSGNNFLSGNNTFANITTIYGVMSSIGNNTLSGSNRLFSAPSGARNTLQGNNTISGGDNFITYVTTISGLLSGVGYNALSGTNVLLGNNTISTSTRINGTLTATGVNLLTGTNTYLGTNFLSGRNTLSGINGMYGVNTLSGENDFYGPLTNTGDVTFYGNFTVIGSATTLQTYQRVLSSVIIDVKNFGTGTALTVDQAGNADIVNFKDDGVSKFFIEGDGGATTGFVGINTDTPNQQLTVNGNISGNNNFNSRYAQIDSSFAGTVRTTGNDKTLSVLASSTASGYVSIKNQFNGVSASSDITLYNNVDNFVDLGIASTAYNGNLYQTPFNITSANDTYLYSSTSAGNLVVGTASSNGDVILFTGGTLSGTSVTTPTGNERLRIKATGNIGINTSTPNRALTIVGDVSATNTIFSRYSTIDSSFSGTRLVGGNDQTLVVRSSSTMSGYVGLQNQFTGPSASTDISIFNNTGAYIDMGINSTGYVGGSYSPAFTVTNNNDGYIFTNTTASNFVLGTQNTAGDLVLFTGGSLSGTSPSGNERLRIKSTGNVGINTSNPNKTLTVVGDISATGTTTLSNVSFTGASVRTFATPITATGDFIVININGTDRAIQLWNIT